MTPKPSPQDQLKQYARQVAEFDKTHYANEQVQEYMREIKEKSDPVFYNNVDLAIAKLGNAADKFINQNAGARATSEIFREQLLLLAYVTYCMDVDTMPTVPPRLENVASDFLHEKPISLPAQCDFDKVQQFIDRCGLHKTLGHIKPGPLFDVIANASAFCDVAGKMQKRGR